MKSLVSILAVSTIILTASAAMADTYGAYPLVGACTTISRDLSTGDRGSDVTTLQTFLVNQNYPGGGAWMITSYFGAATRQAVRNFQAQQGLPVTGTVGSQTRAAISRVSCGGYTGTDTSNPLSYIYGTFPTPAIAPAPFTPAAQPAVPVYTLPTTAANCGTYSILYGYNINCPSTTPTITYLNPVSGSIGDRVTIYGSGFSATGNTVRFGNGIITSLISPDGQSVSFTVPSQLSGFGSQPVGLGTYPVSVSNAAGLTSGTLPFTVTSLGSGSAPTISSVNGPTTLVAGNQGTWTVTFYAPSSYAATVSVRWGDENQYSYMSSVPQTVYGSGTHTVTFTHAYAVSGTYAPVFTVANPSGASNSTSASVIVSGSSTSYGSAMLQYVTPATGRVGTQIILQGSGFTATENTVHFGIGGVQHAVSSGGTQIYYTIPAFISPCDLIGGSCAGSAQQVMSGTYPIYVTNANGTTQTLYFTVTQ